jgi:threonine dehydrogenase-like Zn-dependent dehydrogenase
MLMVQATVLIRCPCSHRFKLDEILEAYDVFGSRRDGCLKVAIKP